MLVSPTATIIALNPAYEHAARALNLPLDAYRPIRKGDFLELRFPDVIQLYQWQGVLEEAITADPALLVLIAGTVPVAAPTAVPVPAPATLPAPVPMRPAQHWLVSFVRGLAFWGALTAVGVLFLLHLFTTGPLP